MCVCCSDFETRQMKSIYCCPTHSNEDEIKMLPARVRRITNCQADAVKQQEGCIEGDCGVCFWGNDESYNQLIECENHLCDTLVHQFCGGLTHIPEG